MLNKRFLAIWMVLLFAFGGLLHAKEYTNTSYYVAYDNNDRKQFALVMPSVNKVYTHEAGHILPDDLTQVDTQFTAFPSYDNGELCFSDLKEGASGDAGADIMAGKCYDVNFFYTQKESVPSKGMAFILTFTPLDRVYEGLAGDTLSFKMVRDGDTIQNENSITGEDYTIFRFDVRNSKVILGEEAGVASLSGSVGDVVNPITAVLEIDADGDGAYGGKEDRTLSVASTNGSFTFGNIAVVKDVVLKGQLIVTVDGYAPYQQVVSLTDGNSIVVDASAALNKPALKEVVSLAGLSQSARMNSVVEFGIRQSGTKVESFSRLISLSQFRAEADLPIGDDRVSSYTFDTGSFPEDVETVEATMQAFDSTKPEDIKNFPGTFTGKGLGGSKSAADEEVGLLSAAFDLLVLKDQNGQDITLDTPTDKLNANVDLSTCINKWTRFITSAQATVIEDWGDYDDADEGYQVPIWSNDNSENAWQFIGVANYHEGDSARFEMCIPDTWGSGYLNCDSPIAFEQPTLMCVNTFDQLGEKLSGIRINGRTTSGQYAYASTGNSGHTSFEVTETDMSKWSFTYSGAVTGWSSVDVTEVPVAVDSESCTYELNITGIVNPYTANIKVTALDTQGVPVGAHKYVTLQHTTYGEHYYSKSGYTDENSMVTFDVEPNIAYVAVYNAGESNVAVNSSVVVPETADTGVYADVNVTDVNKAPYGYISTYPNSLNINLTESTQVSVSAYDNNPDTLTMTSLTVDGVAVTLSNTYESNGVSYFYMSGDLNVSALARGTHTIVATISDGTVDTELTTTFVIEGDRAPIISTPLVATQSGLSPATLFNIDESGTIIKPNDYLFTANAYDPDGDVVTITMELNGTLISTVQTLNDGNYEINVSATDGTSTVWKVFNFTVANQKPIIGQAGISPSQVNLSVNEMMMVYAFVTDPDGDNVGSVVAKDMNTSVEYTMNTHDGLYYTVDINASEIGVVDSRRFELIAHDAAATPLASDAREVMVSIRDFNAAPTFYMPLYDQTVHVGTTVTVSAVAEDPEHTRISYIWTLDGVVQSTVSDGVMAGESILTLTDLDEGVYAVVCVATDADGASVRDSATITVENSAPVFAKEPTSATVKVNSDAVFECEATDTDAPVSYAWSVDGAVVAGETGMTLTLNAAAEVRQTVSCAASDKYDKTAQSAVATFIVYDPSLTHPLTVNTPMENITVSIHDSSDDLKLLDTKQTDATGTAVFDVPGVTVSFSIAFDPSVMITEGALWEELHEELVGDAYNNCQWDQELNITECSTADWCALSTADSMPVWLFNAAKVTDSSDNNISGEDVDANGDGTISSAELYEEALENEDKNGDGELSWAEIGEGEVGAMAFVDVPVRAYTFNFDNDDEHYEQEYYGNFCATENLTFDINITNASGYVSYASTGGSGYGYGRLADGSNSFGMNVTAYQTDSDGNYDFFVRMYDQSNAWTYVELLLDNTEGDLTGANIIYDAVSLTPATLMDVNLTNDVANTYMNLNVNYKGIYMGVFDYVSNDGNTSHRRYYNSNKFNYMISGSSNHNVNKVQIQHGQSDYYGDGNLQSTYLASDYPMLDVEVNVTASGNVTFSGTETDKVDYSMMMMSGKDYSASYDQSSVFDISIASFGNPTAPFNWNDMNVSKIFPANIANAFNAAFPKATNRDTGMQLFEFRDKTAYEILDKLTENDSFFNMVANEPSRSVQYWIYPENEPTVAVDVPSAKVVGSTVKIDHEKVIRPSNPFSIKMDKRKLFD